MITLCNLSSPFISCLVLFVLSSVISEETYEQELDTFDRRDHRQIVFLKDEFYYLNVTKNGTYTVRDIFDCTLKCLSNPSCLSLNLASSKRADGTLWCELLSSTKYNNTEEYRENTSTHHFSIKNPCQSAPCKNGATCVPNYRNGVFICKCKEGFIGEYCQLAPNSCKDLYNINKSNATQMVTLILDSKPTSVLCQMGDFGCGAGAWTPVMKIDGTKGTFHYDSNLWSNRETFNSAGGESGFDNQETKLPTYWNTSFSKICLGMKVGQQINFIVMNKQASSLYSLVADGQYRATSLGRNTWKILLGSQGSLQIYCNREGFNSPCQKNKARIGIISNEINNCIGCDSRIGFGAAGPPDDTNTCGNEAAYGPDNGVRHIKAFGYILLQ